jgi:hypothetical protein
MEIEGHRHHLQCEEVKMGYVQGPAGLVHVNPFGGVLVLCAAHDECGDSDFCRVDKEKCLKY